MAKLVKISDMTKFGDAVARSLRARYKWSRQLRKAVKLHKATERGGEVSVHITVGEGMTDKSGNPLAGMAKAYESGTEQGTYPISPRRSPFLLFRGTNNFSGVWIKTSKPINHPRMKKRGDIRAAVESIKGRATEELRARIKMNLRNEIKVIIDKAKGFK